MADAPEFDSQYAHKYFSADCFNRAWGFIDKEERKAEESQQMIELAMASIWHWTQREDCTDENMSIGYWQASRVYALAGYVEEARRYGQLCLDLSENEAPFFQGYAHEALARAESVAGNQEESKKHLEEAGRLAKLVEDAEDKKLLENDLKTIS